MTDNIKWKEILLALVTEIQRVEDTSYSINLLEEVKMANKDVRKKNKGTEGKSSLDVNVNENANSRILAKLFQYKSPDGKYEILQSLLNYIRDKKDVQKFGEITIESPKITQEAERIDICVQDKSYAIIFENKLFKAGDQPNQLARYINTKKESFNDNEENIFVIYLSRDGNEPAPNSWVDRDTESSYSESFASRYANLSFKDDILRWLKDCVLPYVRKKDTDLESALVQYINYLDRMFMKNNDDLTKWLENKLKEGEGESNEPDHMVKIHCLEKVEGLIATLKKGQPSRSKISVKKLKEFIIPETSETNEDLTNEDLLNKTIAVIENLRDDCRDEVLKPFYTVSEKTNNSEDNSEDNSKGYFDKSHLSHPTAEYCILQNKKWEGEIRFIWDPFFFNANKKYKLKLEIILTDNNANENENGNRINKFKSVQEAIKNVPKLTIQGVKKIYCDKREQAVARAQRLLQINLETNEKLLYFAPDDQEKLFTDIYKSLSGVIKAIDDIYS